MALRRNVYILAFLIALLIFLLSSSYFREPDFKKTPPKELENIKVSDDPTNLSGHYNLLFVITSKIGAIRQRKLLRETLFGIKNNLKPCMQQDGNVYYKFLIEPFQSVEKGTLRDFTAEYVEYDDIVQFPNNSNKTFQESILTWVSKLINYQ